MENLQINAFYYEWMQIKRKEEIKKSNVIRMDLKGKLNVRIFSQKGKRAGMYKA